MNNFELSSPALEAYFLHRLDFFRLQELQRRLLDEVGRRDDGQITLLVCEHPNIITIGRGGSVADINQDSRLIKNGQIEVVYVNRGGGSILHCPGQLAIYPLLPLRWHGLNVGDFLSRLQSGIMETLEELGIHGQTHPGRNGVWGRTGQLAAFGVAVRNWITYYGVYLNICPSLGLFRLVDTDHQNHTPMSCLDAERCGPVKMTAVRASLVRCLSQAFDCDRYHLFTGHPLLKQNDGTNHPPT